MTKKLSNYNPAVDQGAFIDFNDSGSGTVSGGSVTINAQVGKATISLSTSVNGETTFDLVNDRITTDSQILLTIENDNVTAGFPTMGYYDVGTDGSASVQVLNTAATAVAGTAIVNFIVLS